MRSDLCNRCGSCVGLSDGAIVMVDREGEYRPKLVKELSEEQAGRIWEACSGKYFDFPAYRELFYRNASHFHPYTGPYERIGIGYSTDPAIRANGASGGIISQILIYLLEKKMIRGVVTLRMNPDKPWLNEPVIATTREEVLDAAQSKYCISSVNELLPAIASFDGDLAYIGLPPQVQSIRKLQAINDPAVTRIKYIFGPFYGNTLHFSSVRSLLRTYHENDYTAIEKLYFRHGEWPGNMRIEMRGGRVIELKKFHANYLIPFHILKNSLYCTDLTNEFTDISGGDAWAPDYEERGMGYSILFTRTKTGNDLLQKMVDEGYISFGEITENEAITMHSHGYDLKKRGAFIRIRFRRLTGRSVPDYGYALKGFPLSRYLMEAMISFLFLVLGTTPARWFIGLFSPVFIGKWFEKARTFWKKSTYKIKRTNLT
ncbi:MAG: Coenzyme F420 hydrogenase/dehydrogenase, beta subunit C-terminal domain [Bacteroidales bacterium]|nr:Coenzyme F420 hydrogenase/dehydrogenase, beta subunit C-terminal domain [Bacteroidales bacterium]